MKLKQRISAVLTALALIFTLTDPSALGSILNAAGSAFAADKIPVDGITLVSAPASPVAGEPFWGASSVTAKDELPIREKTVTWYLDDGSGTEVTGSAGYNKKYRVQIKFRIDTTNYTISSGVGVFYYVGSSPVKMSTTVEDDVIVAEMSFAATRLPRTNGIEFIASSTIPAGKTEITIDPLLCHSTEQQVLNALPANALIRTEDTDYSITAPITWKNEFNQFDFATSASYDPNVVEEQSFKIRGTVYVPGGSDVEDTTSVYYVYVNVTVLAADILPAPTASTPEGDYYTGITVSLSSSGTIYYTLSENAKGPDPIGGTETETNLKYKGGINLAGVVGATKTYYIKAISYNERYRTSEVKTFIYSITLEPSELTNIPVVHITVTEPVGGELLDAAATVEESDKVPIVSAVSWIGTNTNGKADYNTRYSISVELTPKNMYAFFSTKAYVNGSEAKCTTNPSGSLTVTYTFPKKTAMLPLDKCLIVKPGMVSVKNGTSMSDIGKLLPTTVELEAPEGNLLEEPVPVTWDLSSCPDYDPKEADEQFITLTGKVTLPDYIEYSPGKNITTITVYVGEAGTLVWPTASPPDSSGADGNRTFGEKTTVTLTAEQNAAIFYTIGYEIGYPSGKDYVPDPSTSGGKGYTNPIVLEGIPGEIVTYTIKAIATAPGIKDSPVNTFKYTLVIPKQTVATPTANYDSGKYEQSLEIALNTTTVGAEIWYTTDPTAKVENFKKYEGVFKLEGKANSTKIYTIRCYAKDPEGKMNDSDIASYSYTITLPKDKALAPYPNHTSGVSYEDTLTLTLTCNTPNTEIYYTINSTLDPSNGISGKKYTGSFKLKKETNQIVSYTVMTYAKSLDPNIENSSVVTYTFTIGLDYGVKSIEISKRPLKYSYYLGELLNVTGGEIKVTYDDGTTELVPIDDDMIDDFDSWVLGQQSVTVNYKGRSTQFNIIVRKRSNTTGDTSTGNDTGNTTTDTGKETDSGSDNTPITITDDVVSDPTMEGSAVKGWKQLQLKIKAAEVGSRVVIYLNGTTSVPADIINTATSRKVTLEFVVNDSIRWVVDAGALKKTVANVSVGLRNKDVYIPSVLVDSSGDSEVVRLHVYGDNKVGAMLYVKTGCKQKNHFVNLFRYDEDSHTLDFVSTSKVASSTGLAQVKPTKAGDYVLMLDTRTRLPGDADNSTTVDARDSSAILKMMVGIMELDDTCDFNNDGFINALDAAAILKSVVGLK